MASVWIQEDGRCSTLQNSMPRTELPEMSSGGDHRAMPITFGMTRSNPPHTPDLAGKPTYITSNQSSSSFSLESVNY